MAVTQVKYNEAVNQERGAGKKGEICVSLSLTFPRPLSSSYYLKYMYKNMRLPNDKPSDLLKPHLI